MVSLTVACQRPGVLATGPLPVWLHFIHQLKRKRKRERKEERRGWGKGAEGGRCGQSQEPSIWEAEGVLELKEG